MERNVTIVELMMATGLSRSKILRSLSACPITGQSNAGLGRPSKTFSIAWLAREKQELHRSLMSYRKRQFIEKALAGAEVTVPAKHDRAVQPPAVFNRAIGEGFSNEAIDKALARALLVNHYRKLECRRVKHGQVSRGKLDFITAYNLGPAGLYPDIFKKVGKVSYKTIQRWKSLVDASNGNALELLDARGRHRMGSSVVTDEERKILIAIYLHPNKLQAAETVRLARKKMGEQGITPSCCDGTYLNFLKTFRVNNYADFNFYRGGEKTLNEECAFHVARDYDRIEVGDVIFCDGHIWNQEGINPYTGKKCRLTLITWFDMKSSYPLGWEISPTENTEAITMALYRAILRLGKLPKLAYLDNGKAFRSAFFNKTKDFKQSKIAGLFQLLGMDKIFAWAYHGESKTVERWHKTLGECERRAPSYVGTSIQGKPPRLLRGEKIHRRLYAKVYGDNLPTVEDMHRQLASWVDEYAARPQRGHLKGQSPIDVFESGIGPGFSVEEAARLRMLMMSIEVRKIHRDGIKLPGCESKFYHPDLYGRQQQSAIVRYDSQDRSVAYVYDMENRFICAAEAMNKVHPAAYHLGTDADREELKRQIEMKKSSEKETVGPARAFLEANVMPSVEIRQNALEEKRRLEAARTLLTGADEPKQLPEPLTPDQEREIQRALDEHQAREEGKYGDTPTVKVTHYLSNGCAVHERLPRTADMERYERLQILEARGIELAEKDAAWMSFYEGTPEYGAAKSHFVWHKDQAFMSGWRVVHA